VAGDVHARSSDPANKNRLSGSEGALRHPSPPLLSRRRERHKYGVLWCGHGEHFRAGGRRPLARPLLGGWTGPGFAPKAHAGGVGGRPPPVNRMTGRWAKPIEHAGRRLARLGRGNLPDQAPRRPDGRGNQPGAGRAVGAGTHRQATCRGGVAPHENRLCQLSVTPTLQVTEEYSHDTAEVPTSQRSAHNTPWHTSRFQAITVV
jgi:hypothetical protein